MKPLYTEDQFKLSKSHDKLPCECYRCGKTFLKIKHDIVKFINGTMQRGSIKYCSKSCSISAANSIYDVQKQLVICKQCNMEFQKSSSHIVHSANNFCSRSCAATYNNTHKKHGTRRSKLEAWLEQQLPSLYPLLEFHFNRKDAINAELDIFIPSLKLAFELNGIFHYEPIYGPEKLAQIQTNDERKFQACLENDIELCLIDVSSFSYFKLEGAQKYLNGIQEIIDKKLGR